jgi:hypothetical protein
MRGEENMAEKKQGKTSNPAQPIAGMRPGGPNNPDPGYTPGPDYVGVPDGAESAAGMTGAGTGGNIDLPDITGRGTTRDITQHAGQPTPDQRSAAPGGRSPERKPERS